MIRCMFLKYRYGSGINERLEGAGQQGEVQKFM